jgi:uncharacterized protein
MKTIKILFFAIVGIIAATPCFADTNGTDLGACHYTPEALQSWKDLWVRQLRILDPPHAAQLSKVTSEIIDGRLDALRIEIASGVSANSSLKGAGGDMSLLELAVAACQDKVARELVRLGASANGGTTSASLVVAAAKGEADLAEFLISHGASVDKVDINGHTALEDGVRQHQLAAVQVLLKHGSNPNIPLARNATILELAANSSDPTDQAIASELRANSAASGLAGEK